VRIATRESLREHLRLAMSVELSTVPPYLYALYSMEHQASDAAALLRSIVAEEMLHLALATNLLLATGGEPDLLSADLRPTYPGLLAHRTPPLMLNLAPATDDQIRTTFMGIEQPDPPGHSPDPDAYDSLGEFYAAIEEAIEAFGPGLFAHPQADRQLSDPRFYGPVRFNVEASGDLMLIDGVDSARAAIEVIVHQGEGLTDARWADPGHQELTHYAKLAQIADGITPIGAIRPVRVNPRAVEFPASVRPVADLFNAVYGSLFILLDALYRPTPAKGHLVNQLYGLMRRVLGPIGLHLTTLPLGDGFVASPTFEAYPLGPDPAETLAALAGAVAAQHPVLAEALEPLLERRLLPEARLPG